MAPCNARNGLKAFLPDRIATPLYGGNDVSYLADKIKATLLVQSRIAHHELCRLANLHFDTGIGHRRRRKSERQTDEMWKVGAVFSGELLSLIASRGHNKGQGAIAPPTLMTEWAWPPPNSADSQYLLHTLIGKGFRLGTV